MAAAVSALVPALANTHLSDTADNPQIFPPIRPQPNPRDTAIVNLLGTTGYITAAPVAELVVEHAQYQPNQSLKTTSGAPCEWLSNDLTANQRKAIHAVLKTVLEQTGNLVLSSQFNDSPERKIERLLPVIGALHGTIHTLALQFGYDQSPMSPVLGAHGSCEPARAAQLLWQRLPPTTPLEHLTVRSSLIDVRGEDHANDQDSRACVQAVRSTFTAWLQRAEALTDLTIDCENGSTIPFIHMPLQVRRITLLDSTANSAAVRAWQELHAPHAEIIFRQPSIEYATQRALAEARQRIVQNISR